MGKEIERKYLVHKAYWGALEKPEGMDIRQGYLNRTPENTVRIRIKKGVGYLTIKGKQESGVRPEFEYLIPFNEAVEMLDLFCDRVLHKTRFEILHKGHLWEVDEFHSPNKGLVLAEIELTNPAESFELPGWVSKEVTGLPEYYNANML